jgi:2-polyprenyl-3-methyl-5-hydroxy-6-metoxy-1,4-benzoquinol methylase
MAPSAEQVRAGQAIYTPGTLRVYDIFVLGISNQFIWKCPSSRIDAHYNANVSGNHLEVGVGTGYFPDRCAFSVAQPRIGLMDLNPNTLNFASRRIARYQPETYVQNILEPITQQIDAFDSIGINYLFHCVPGTISEKAVAFDHLGKLMKPGCRVFGSTILQGGVSRNWAARKLMAVYNKKGVFSNTQDDLESLNTALSQRFERVNIEVSGCVALFSARNP